MPSDRVPPFICFIQSFTLQNALHYSDASIWLPKLQKIDCLCNALFSRHQRKRSRSAFLAPSEWNPSVTRVFLSQRPVMRKAFPWYDVIMSQCLDVSYHTWEIVDYWVYQRPWHRVNAIRHHYSDVIMNSMAYQITGVSIICTTVCSGADQRKHQSSSLLACVRGIYRWPVNSPHKGPVPRKIFPFDDVIMIEKTDRGTCAEYFHIQTKIIYSESRFIWITLNVHDFIIRSIDAFILYSNILT